MTTKKRAEYKFTSLFISLKKPHEMIKKKEKTQLEVFTPNFVQISILIRLLRQLIF